LDDHMEDGYRIYGDPQKIVEEIGEEIADKISKSIEEIKSTAKKEAYEAISRKALELRSRIDDSLKRYRNFVESTRSKIEVELKKISERRKEEWVNKIVAEIKERFIRGIVSDKNSYRELLKRSLESVLTSEKEIHIETNDSTAELLEEIIEELGLRERIRSINKSLNIRGGFIATSPDRSIRYNYTLEHMIDNNIYELKVRISRILFG